MECLPPCQGKKDVAMQFFVCFAFFLTLFFVGGVG